MPPRLPLALALLALAPLAPLAPLAGCDGSPSPRADAAQRDGRTSADDAASFADASAPPDGTSDAAAPDSAAAPADATLPDGPTAMPDPVVFGAHGVVGNVVCKAQAPVATKACQRHDMAWLRAVYGVVVERADPAAAAAAGAVYRLIQIAERDGPVALEVWVVDAAGKRRAKTPVNVCYPVTRDAAGNARCSANHVPLVVKDQGHADFTMTASGYTGCGQMGPYAAWVAEPNVPSDRVYGLGMLAKTNHRHVNLLFQRVSVGAGKPASATRCPLVE